MSIEANAILIIEINYAVRKRTTWKQRVSSIISYTSHWNAALCIAIIIVIIVSWLMKSESIPSPNKLKTPKNAHWSQPNRYDFGRSNGNLLNSLQICLWFWWLLMTFHIKISFFSAPLLSLLPPPLLLLSKCAKVFTLIFIRWHPNGQPKCAAIIRLAKPKHFSYLSSRIISSYSNKFLLTIAVLCALSFGLRFCRIDLALCVQVSFRVLDVRILVGALFIFQFHIVMVFTTTRTDISITCYFGIFTTVKLYWYLMTFNSMDFGNPHKAKFETATQAKKKERGAKIPQRRNAFTSQRKTSSGCDQKIFHIKSQ